MQIENFKNEIDVFVEIVKGSQIKYEYDKIRKVLVCDRILHTPFTYIFNYGFIPDTLSQDNDPIATIIIMEHTLVPGSFIKCKIIGCLETSDNEGNDPKLIMCPISKVDPTYSNINEITDIPEQTLNQIKYFFAHYKDLENKKVDIRDFVNKEKAIQIYLESLENYKKETK